MPTNLRAESEVAAPRPERRKRTKKPASFGLGHPTLVVLLALERAVFSQSVVIP